MYTGFGTIVTAAITPFDAHGAVDHGELRRLLRHLEATGSDGVVIAGTTGESPTLSDDEKVACFVTAVDEVGGRMAVLAGTGTNDTRHSIELTRRAVEAGVDGLLVVTPYYNKPPRDGLLQHFTAVARAAGDTPVMLYNVPGRVIVELEPDLIAELAQLPNVVALKQAHPDLRTLREIRTLAPDLAVYAGDDTSLLPMLGDGAVGVVSVAAHVVGEQMAQVVELWRSGREAEARELTDSLGDVYETINALTTNPIPVKAAMALLGFNVGTPRLPLVEATGLQRERIRAMLERHELVPTHA
ncbi:MAG: dihydrodipicolinate synthase [Thermoleophilia bacterium]|jgi:4-hydroxy-tetrahydrodipicolinate synthase|nr:dihydrodipicolinate synthase [Thermoleophilia bacterium]